ncbi:DeoR faimly transcriptional regulator [Knoellia flava TL1]|uniref:DeoR family transcriptional regulator n=2 Tax=Knoellia flava TaxID=913969 RepID=A0A8H9FUW3_9MICO|nr:DeoR faimly transcriptional regulator [Knoellia flava TL1]GGB79019.1 DeoR family transcriptional regulator [Knoellia flava]
MCLVADALGPSEAVLAAAVARRHLIDGESKVDLATSLGISRFKVARLLDAARESGMVRIEVVSPVGIDTDRSARLRDALGLEHCVVVPGSGAQADPGVSAAAAALLSEVVTDKDVLGLPWSRSVSRMVDALTSLPRIPVVQLSGAMVTPEEDSSSVDVVRRAARIAGGGRHVFYSPLLLDDAASAEVMRRQPPVREALDRVADVTLAVIGLGAWTPGTSTIHDVLKPADRKAVARSGAVGEAAGVFFDADGAVVDTPLTARIVGLTGEQLHGIRHVIGIAHGPDKVDAIAAAVKGDLIESLVTTADTADALLDLR